MTNPTSSRWLNRGLALALLLFIFAAGLGVGWGIARWSDSPRARESRRGERSRGRHFYASLNLSPEQARAVREIHERHRPRLDAVLEETTPKIRAIHDEIEQEIRQLLTPVQLERLERQKARRGQLRGPGKRRGRGQGRGPGPGPGPGPGLGI